MSGYNQVRQERHTSAVPRQHQFPVPHSAPQDHNPPCGNQDQMPPPPPPPPNHPSSQPLPPAPPSWGTPPPIIPDAPGNVSVHFKDFPRFPSMQLSEPHKAPFQPRYRIPPPRLQEVHQGRFEAPSGPQQQPFPQQSFRSSSVQGQSPAGCDALKPTKSSQGNPPSNTPRSTFPPYHNAPPPDFSFHAPPEFGGKLPFESPRFGFPSNSPGSRFTLPPPHLRPPTPPLQPPPSLHPHQGGPPLGGPHPRSHHDSATLPPGIQPYQSHRTRNHAPTPASGISEHQGPFSGAPKPDIVRIGRASTQGDGKEQDVWESEDQKWVRVWALRRCDIDAGQEKEKKKKQAIRIADAQVMVRKFVRLLEELKERRDEAEALMPEETSYAWRQKCHHMKEQVAALSALQNVISNPDFVTNLKKQVERRRRKRENLKRRRREEWEEREEALKQRQETVDARMAKELQIKQDKEREDALQKDVDNTLSEVRKKKQDVNKTMELLRALRKLRVLRKESSEKKGFRAPKEFEVLFEEKVSALDAMMNRQKLLYVEEERALQVMLETEQEETREKERLKKQEQERKKAEKEWAEHLELLFGKAESVELGHPLFMFRQFHLQAEYDVQSLINVRRQWDAFLVPETDPAGTSVPLSWVSPSKPSNLIWATALEEQSDT